MNRTTNTVQNIQKSHHPSLDSVRHLAPEFTVFQKSSRIVFNAAQEILKGEANLPPPLSRLSYTNKCFNAVGMWGHRTFEFFLRFLFLFLLFARGGCGRALSHPWPSHCVGTGVPCVSLPGPTSVVFDAQAGWHRGQKANSCGRARVSVRCAASHKHSFD